MSIRLRAEPVRTLLRLLPVLLLGVVACKPVDTTRLISLPPPPGWEQQLASDRAAKDARFRADPETPLLPEDLDSFEGLRYWEPDPSWYFVGPVNLYPDPERFTIISTSGKPRPCEKVGWIRFEVEGRMETLQVYRLLDSPPREGAAGYFLPFMDATTGNETYPSGRYLDLDGPVGGPFLIDFNRAYNPLCAYGAPERFSCPTTPPENRLDIRVEVGELGFRKDSAG